MFGNKDLKKRIAVLEDHVVQLLNDVKQMKCGHNADDFKDWNYDSSYCGFGYMYYKECSLCGYTVYITKDTWTKEYKEWVDRRASLK